MADHFYALFFLKLLHFLIISSEKQNGRVPTTKSTVHSQPIAFKAFFPAGTPNFRTNTHRVTLFIGVDH